MIKIIKVNGDSLYPEIKQGDFVMISKIPLRFGYPKPGDVLVFKHSIYGTLIKRVDHANRERDEIYVIGAHPSSNDSRQFGPIHRADLLGKVIWHVPKR